MPEGEYRWVSHDLNGSGTLQIQSEQQRALVRTGYDGPVSLEIFNDTFRQSDPKAIAVEARRSLRWLEHQTAAVRGFGPLTGSPPL